MSELSTPTVGLQVQSQKAEMRPGPQVDVSGAMRGQPDWQALGEAGRNLGQTVTNLFNDTAAKSAFLEYQKELGDIERNYINSNGNGSPEEIRKVQDLTNKAWSKFQQSTRNLAGSNTYKIIEEANKYGVRFRDSILNNRAKFAEDYYQKNQAALVATNTEDYVFAADDPKSEAFASANAELERNLSELLIHNGFDKDDPLYTKTMADAKSAAILGNIKFHVANKDYTQGWKNYTYYVEQGILTGENRTTALQMLQILEDELAAKSATSSGAKDNIVYNLMTGQLTDPQKHIVTNKLLPAALRHEADLRNSERARRSLAIDIWQQAKKAGGTVNDDGSITLNGNTIQKPPEMSTPKPYDQIYSEVFHKVDIGNTQKAKFYKAGGQSAGMVSLGIEQLRMAATEASNKQGSENALADFNTTVMALTPEQLIALSGAFDSKFAAQVAADLQTVMGEKAFSELVDYWRYGVVRNAGDYAAQRIRAERMSLEDFELVQKMAAEEGISEAQVISRAYGIPLLPANDVYVKLLEFNSNPDNNYAGTTQRQFIDMYRRQAGDIFADKMGVTGSQAISDYIKDPTIKPILQELMLGAYYKVAKENEYLVARRTEAAAKKGDKPENHMQESYEWMLLRPNEIGSEFLDVFEQMAQDYADEQEALFTGRPRLKREEIVLYGTSFSVPTTSVIARPPYQLGGNTVEAGPVDALGEIGNALNALGDFYVNNPNTLGVAANFATPAVNLTGSTQMPQMTNKGILDSIQQTNVEILLGSTEQVKQNATTITDILKSFVGKFNEFVGAFKDEIDAAPVTLRAQKLDNALSNIGRGTVGKEVQQRGDIALPSSTATFQQTLADMNDSLREVEDFTQMISRDVGLMAVTNPLAVSSIQESLSDRLLNIYGQLGGYLQAVSVSNANHGLDAEQKQLIAARETVAKLIEIVNDIYLQASHARFQNQSIEMGTQGKYGIVLDELQKAYKNLEEWSNEDTSSMEFTSGLGNAFGDNLERGNGRRSSGSKRGNKRFDDLLNEINAGNQ